MTFVFPYGLRANLLTDNASVWPFSKSGIYMASWRCTILGGIINGVGTSWIGISGVVRKAFHPREVEDRNTQLV